MSLNNLKIAWRNVWRSKLFTSLNILGLALGFAGFILAYLYINRETSYDKWNPNYEHIYLVGLTYQGQFTDQTPPSLANRIKEKVPEVKEVGRVYHYTWGGTPLFGDEVALINSAKLADKGFARIMAVEPRGFALDDTAYSGVNLVSESIAKILFRETGGQLAEPRNVGMLSANAGMYEKIHGIGEKRSLSIFDYEFVLIDDDRILEEREGNPFFYQTYIQVHEHANLAAVQRKINDIYRQEVSQHQYSISSAFAGGEVYLDPLKNLHLRPKNGSSSGYFIVLALGLLSIVILILAAVNFANLMVSQANRRAKEVGVKKIFGVGRKRLALQFLLEVFVQCLLAAIIACWMVGLCQNGLQKWFGYEIGDFSSNTRLIWQFIAATLATAVVSGSYPAFFLSGLKPTSVLKGGFSTSHRMQWFRNGLLTFQFVIAILFITSMFILSRQLAYIRSEERGFEPSQVIALKNWGMYIPIIEGIDGLRNKLVVHPEIQHVTATTDAPGNIESPPIKQFSYIDAVKEAEHIGVSDDYFATLAIPIMQGRGFTREFANDTSHYAILNESAVAAFGMSEPIGSKISGCNVDFTVVGVVKDSKVHGFEKLIRPTVYSTRDECGPARYKTTVLVKTAIGGTPKALELLKTTWANNKYAESIPFMYEFLEQNYAALHARQEQLRAATSGFTALSIVIAMMGLFSMSAYSISIREKEMSIRKVLGASVGQLFMQLNRPFFRILLIANLIALPVAYLLVNRYLATFAYRITVHWWMFALAGTAALLIALLTVAYQSVRAARANPVDSLRDE
ncbi:ABC transporter permease [Parapedobacter sp. 2B3]|uniref:ABC transporter permease n=1 Tax=Parapedobacter sp. 2B3 TaxID=3342381 RepID=UPI0035B5D8C7